MEREDILKQIEALAGKKTEGMYLNDFLLTWDKSDDEVAATFLAAEILRAMRGSNISCRGFDSGLAVSIFRDNSTRTRFSFASAANLLGLAVQDLDELAEFVLDGIRDSTNEISDTQSSIDRRGTSWNYQCKRSRYRS